MEVHGEVDENTSRELAASPWLSHLESLKVLGDAWPRLSRIAESRLDALVQLHVLAFRGKKSQPTACDAGVAALAGNPTLANLRLLELHLPMTGTNLAHLASMKGLRRLKVHLSLKDCAGQLKAALPDCKIEFTSYSL